MQQRGTWKFFPRFSSSRTGTEPQVAFFVLGTRIILASCSSSKVGTQNEVNPSILSARPSETLPTPLLQERTKKMSSNMMNSVCLCLAIGLSLMAMGVEADLRRGNAIDDFAFGRPISTGARRKRLPGKELRAGSGLLTIEELEKEFEAVR